MSSLSNNRLLAGRHILIIEDIPEDRAQLRRLLYAGSDRSFRFTEAASGSEGIALLRAAGATPPDCILLDYHLPDMTAPEVLARTGALTGKAAAPFIVITGSERELGSQVLQAGAQDFIGKSWLTAESLTRAIENALERFSLIQERSAIAAQLAQSEGMLRALADSLESQVRARTAELRETVTELESFSYSIAHDMRAPLRTMQGFATILAEDHRDQLNEAGRDYLGRIAASALWLDRLIVDILDYGRVVRGEMNLGWVDLEGAVTETIAAYPPLTLHQTRIVVGRLPVVWANRAGVNQVLSNLLDNAVKFTRPGVDPEVKIWGLTLDGRVRLWVEDKGIGIPAEAHARLFDLFFRLNPLESYHGTGMGLAMARKTLKRMGGQIGVESEPGRGSRFWIELQAAAKPLI